MGLQAINNSRLLPTPLLLEPLATGEETELCRVELVVKLQQRLEGMDKEQLKEKEYLEERKRLEFLKNLLDQPLFLQAVDSLGRVPRFLQFFLTKLMTTMPKQNLEEFLSGVMDSVVDEVKTTYGTKNWDDFLGGSPTGVRNMILWALSAKEVSLTDRLNGITVEQARATGILMLEEVKDSHPTKYIINIPLVLLRALNKELRDVPDDYLNPVRSIDDREFEKVMSTLRILRQNMLVNIGKKTATYRELYPHALGYDEDLDQEVPLKRLEEVWVDGSSAAHDSMHRIPYECSSCSQLSTKGH